MVKENNRMGMGKDLYQSIIFTWDLPLAKSNAIIWKQKHKSGKIFIGGPAAKLMPDYITWGKVLDSTKFDVLSFHNPLATFTTRGCINKCSFCAVPIIEPEYEELDNWKVAPILCDNNFLAASKKHRLSVYKKLEKAKFKTIDFNQGLEAKLLTEFDVKWLVKLKCKIRFAFDHINNEKEVVNAIEMVQKFRKGNLGCYVLIGYNDTQEDALYRLEKIRSFGILPSPMRYQPLDSLKKNTYISPDWDRYQMEKIMKYYSRLAYLGNVCSFSEFIHNGNKRTVSTHIPRKSIFST